MEEKPIEDNLSNPRPNNLVHKVSNYLIKNSPGMRVIKTALAIIICMVIEYFRASSSPYYSSIATVVCLQPTLKSTLNSAIDRTLGTIVAGVYSYLLAVLLVSAWGLSPGSIEYFVLIGALSFPLMTIMLVIKKPAALAITVIVYLVIMLSITDTEPLSYTIERVVATLIGIAVALFINWLPFLNKIGTRMGTVDIGEILKENAEMSNR